MGFFSKFNYNGNGVIRTDIGDTDAFPFMHIRDYEGAVIKVYGFFFTNGKHGEQVVVVGNGAKINMPGYATKIFHRIEEDSEAVDRILKGEMVLKDIGPLETKRGKTVGFTIADASEVEDVPEGE